jgi:hypothetical protein
MGLIHKNTTNAMAAANRANALKSTGPVTDEGKLNVRMNALKHGVLAEVGPVIPQLEERDEDLLDLEFLFSASQTAQYPKSTKQSRQVSENKRTLKPSNEFLVSTFE